MNNLDQGSVVTDEQAAHHLGNGHPKSNPPSLQDGSPFPANTTGAGSAAGANGPPTTGAVGPGGAITST